MIILILPLMTVSADSNVSMNMELYNTVYRGLDDWYYAGSGKAALNVKSARNPNVQGHMEVEFFPMDLIGGGAVSSVPLLNLKRAYVRARFPGFRMTLGKSRLAWGEGIVFNSGDILFGSMNPVLDLTDEELRSDTAWLTSVNIPLGNFAFAEAVVMPPSFNLADLSEPIGDISKSSAGGRLYFKVLDTKVECGYLYKGEQKVDADVIGHRPYISLQGNIGPDWYLSSSAAFPTDAQQSEGAGGDWEESWNISFGLFHMQEINRNNTLNMRLETLWFPYQNWEDQGERDSIYGVYLYPELTWTQGSSVFYSLQSVISPFDGSAMITGGAGWNIFQGFYLLGYVTVLAGEETDTFAWDRGSEWIAGQDVMNGISMMTGVRYKY